MSHVTHREQRHLVRVSQTYPGTLVTPLITLQAAQHHGSGTKQRHPRVLRNLARVHPLFAVPGLPARRVLCIRGHPRPRGRHQPEHIVLVRLEQGSVRRPIRKWSADFSCTMTAVGGCVPHVEDDAGNLEFDWLEVQLDRFRDRGMQVCNKEAPRLHVRLYDVALNTVCDPPSTGHTLRTHSTRTRALLPRLLLPVRSDRPPIPGHDCGPPIRAHEHRPLLLGRRRGRDEGAARAAGPRQGL